MKRFRFLTACRGCSVSFLQSQASSTKLGSQLAEAESLLQKQDLLETRVSALGETIGVVSATAMKVGKPETKTCSSGHNDDRCNRTSLCVSAVVELYSVLCPLDLSLCQVKVGDVHQIQSKVRALDTQYKSLVSLCSSRSSSLITDT